MKIKVFILGFSAAFMINACQPNAEKTTMNVDKDSTAKTDPLPSWNTPLKTDIISYVEKVTAAGSPDFIPDKNRIATFDNDGTL